MDEFRYLEIAHKYGRCGSWAVWADVGLTPKSNVGDLSIFDQRSNTALLNQLNPNVVMVGLNISRGVDGTFANFHDGSSKSQDYKIRYAFSESPYYGAYMTDVIKYLSCKDSGEVMRHLRSNPGVEQQNVESFQAELDDIGAKDPLIIAFGNHAFSILDKHLNHRFRIIRITHYSHHISKENYRSEVARMLAGI